MSRVFTSVLLSCASSLFLFAADPGGGAPAAPAGGTDPRAEDQKAGDLAAVHFVIDTLAVDGKGTRIVGTDEADLLPGAAGVLEKSIRLVSRGTPRREETVRLKARVTPLPSPPSGAACAVTVDIESAPEPAHAAGRGKTRPPEITSATVILGSGEERLLEAYASATTQGRVALKVRCAPAVPQASTVDEALLVTLNVIIERTADDEQTELLRSQVLTAALARSALTVASANKSLPDGAGGDRRFRRETLEVTLSPVLIVAGRLQIEVRMVGEVATVSAAEETIRHPVEASETLVVEPGEPRFLDIEVLSGNPDEGWSRLRYRIQVSGRF